jgi:hypothetical protein
MVDIKFASVITDFLYGLSPGSPEQIPHPTLLRNVRLSNLYIERDRMDKIIAPRFQSSKVSLPSFAFLDWRCLSELPCENLTVSGLVLSSQLHSHWRFDNLKYLLLQNVSIVQSKLLRIPGNSEKLLRVLRRNSSELLVSSSSSPSHHQSLELCEVTDITRGSFDKLPTNCSLFPLIHQNHTQRS